MKVDHEIKLFESEQSIFFHVMMNELFSRYESRNVVGRFRLSLECAEISEFLYEFVSM